MYQFSLFLDVSFIYHLIIFGSVFLHSLSIYLLSIYISVIYLFICYCCKKIQLERSHNYGVWNYWQQKLLYDICYIIWIGWHMILGLWTGAETYGLDDVSPWWPLFTSRSSVSIYIYIIFIYMHILYESCYRTYIYIQQECHSVLVKLHRITFYMTVFECHFLFPLVYQLCLALWWK